MMRVLGTAGACCALALAAALFAAGCANPPAQEVESGAGQVAVDVYGGLGGPAPAAGGGSKRLEVVLDVSSSMLERSRDGSPHVDAARAGANDLVYSVRDGMEIAVRALGNVPANIAAEPGPNEGPSRNHCVPSQRIVDPVVTERREPIAERISDVSVASESSLASALDSVRRDLILESASSRTRVVVFSDLDDSCGGDLCKAASALVDSGAWLEIVPIGRSNPPECLAALRPTSATPFVDSRFRVKPPTFRVEGARGPSPKAPVLATGETGGVPVTVPAGLVTVHVGLDPPEEVGPFMVRPGELARIRVLDAFDAALPTRVWRVERGVEPVGRAFPPPPDVGTAAAGGPTP